MSKREDVDNGGVLNLAQRFEQARRANGTKKTHYKPELWDDAFCLVESGIKISDVANACGVAPNSLRAQVDKRLKPSARRVRVARTVAPVLKKGNTSQMRSVKLPNGILIRVLTSELDSKFLSRLME